MKASHARPGDLFEHERAAVRVMSPAETWKAPKGDRGRWVRFEIHDGKGQKVVRFPADKELMMLPEVGEPDG